MAVKVAPSKLVHLLNETLSRNGDQVTVFLYPEGADDSSARGYDWHPRTVDSAAAVAKASRELEVTYVVDLRPRT